MTGVIGDHPWRSAHEEFEGVVLPFLRKSGIEIGKRANDGDEHCLRVIKYYDLLHRSFDPMTLMLLCEEIKKAGYKLEALHG